MKLPKYDIANHVTTLPASGKVVKYRPYLVKEEKMLLQAAAGGDMTEATNIIKQVIENTCTVEVKSIPMIDIEWLFLKLRVVSNGNVTEIKVRNKCESECEPYALTAANLELVDVRGLNLLKDKGFVQKKDKWLVKFDEENGCSLKFGVSDKTDPMEILKDMTVEIYHGDTVFNVAECSQEEFTEWVESLPKPFADKLMDFYKSQPYLSLNVNWNCPTCNKDHERELRGIESFFV